MTRFALSDKETFMKGSYGPVGPGRYGVLAPVEFARLGHRPGLYRDLGERNRVATIPHVIAQLEASGTIDNFRRLVGESDAPYRGMKFQDSDLYKTLEGIAWTLARTNQTKRADQADQTDSIDQAGLRSFFDQMVGLLARAQRPDGYLNSHFQRADRVQQPWSDFAHGHELYCLGHLIQAALAASRVLGDDRLLEIALRNVELVIQLFGGPAAASDAYPGHPEIETALVELYRHTGDDRYRDLAATFINRRGQGALSSGMFGLPYYQDDLPVRQTRIMRGHAVRALYLNAGVTDLYLETGEAALLEAMRVQWDDMVSRRLYITGGTGSRHSDEAFGDGFELPSDRAYAETCAGIALLQWAWRMFLATGEAAVLDEFERTLHNVVMAGVSADGRAFFYTNPLQRRPDHDGSEQTSESKRLTWYSCACCPPNLTRTMATLENCVVAAAEGDIRVAVYAPVVAEVGGVRLTIDTRYPEDGRVRIAVSGTSTAMLRLRLPAWAKGAFTVRIDGAAASPPVDAGWILLADALNDGTVIELELPLIPRVIVAHPAVDGVRGAAAVMRGPVVYCAEQGDNDVPIDEVALVAQAGLLDQPGAEPRLTATVRPDPRAAVGAPLYAEYDERSALGDPTTLVLRPYSTWGNSETSGAMRVWLALAP
jgi:DUF1680 family protein